MKLPVAGLIAAVALFGCDKEEETPEEVKTVQCPTGQTIAQNKTQISLAEEGETNAESTQMLDQNGCPMVQNTIQQPAQQNSGSKPPPPTTKPKPKPTIETAENATDCGIAGGHWWAEECQTEPAPTIETALNEEDCHYADGYWYLDTCNTDKGTLGSPTWYVTNVNRTIWMAGDTEPRTVTLKIPNGMLYDDFDKIECRAGTNPFGPCTKISDDKMLVSFTFEPDQFNDLLEWRISDTNYNEATYQFNPSFTSYYRDPTTLTYVTCDATYTGAYTFSAFAAQLSTDYGAGKRVICLGSDIANFSAVTLDAGGGDRLELASMSNLTLIGHTRSAAFFTNYRVDAGATENGVFYIPSSSNNVKLINLIINSDGDSGRGVYVVFASGVEIQGGAVETEGASAHGIYFSSASSPKVEGTTIRTNGGSSYGAYFSSTTDVDVSHVQVKTIGANAHGIYFSQSATYGSIKNSTVKTTGDSNAIEAFVLGADPDVDGYPGIEVRDSILVAMNDGNDQQVFAASIYDSSAWFKDNYFVLGSGNNSEALAVGRPGSIYETGNTGTRVEIEGNVFIRHNNIDGSNGKAILLGDGTDGDANAPDLRNVEVGTLTPATNTYCNYDSTSSAAWTGSLRDNHGIVDIGVALPNFSESSPTINECSAWDKSYIYGALNYL